MLKQAEITTTLKSIPWFLDLSTESINRLSAIADVISCEPGKIIYNESDQHPFFYVVLKGRICLESFVPGLGSLPIHTAESLDVLGWSSLTPIVRQMPNKAIVQTRAKLLRFRADDLMACFEEDCELGFVFMRRLANIVASYYLTNRLNLLEIIACQK